MSRVIYYLLDLPSTKAKGRLGRKYLLRFLFPTGHAGGDSIIDGLINSIIIKFGMRGNMSNHREHKKNALEQ